MIINTILAMLLSSAVTQRTVFPASVRMHVSAAVHTVYAAKAAVPCHLIGSGRKIAANMAADFNRWVFPAPGEYYFDCRFTRELAARIYGSKFLGIKFTEGTIPKPPIATNHRSSWTKMLFCWFFELGSDTAYFASNSPESTDIANSYSMQQLRMQYYQTGEIPAGWVFSGPETALGVYGEVEWFIGSYSIRNFKLQNGIATFEVLNTSGWESGTRLPATWHESLQKQTYLPVPAKAFVDDAPRGKVLASKITERFPGLLKYSGAAKLLERMPSFGGNWYQIYAVEMEW